MTIKNEAGTSHFLVRVVISLRDNLLWGPILAIYKYLTSKSGDVRCLPFRVSLIFTWLRSTAKKCAESEFGLWVTVCQSSHPALKIKLGLVCSLELLTEVYLFHIPIIMGCTLNLRI